MYQRREEREPYNIIYTATSEEDFSIGYKGDRNNRRPVLFSREGQTAYAGNQTKILNRGQGKVWYVTESKKEGKRWENRSINEMGMDSLDSLTNPEKIRWD